MAELVAQMNSVVADKTNLESRVSVLLRVLQMRDEQIEQLRSGQKVSLHLGIFLGLHTFELHIELAPQRCAAPGNSLWSAAKCQQIPAQDASASHFGQSMGRSGVHIAALNCW